MGINHVYTSPVPDATGTLTVWAGATTSTVAASDVVMPSHWNSQHIVNYSLSGNTAGNSTVSGLDVVWQAGNNITLSGTGSTIVISAANGGGAGDGGNVLAAGTQTANTTGTVLFNNGNNVTFGMDNSSVITASASYPAQSVQTQNMVSVLGSTGNISFANSNGITFGGNASTITASHNGLTSQSNQAYSAANGSAAFQTLSFADSNGVSFSTGTQGLYATVKTDYLTSQSNQAFSASGGSSAFQTLNFANGNGATFSNNAGSVQLSYTVPSTAGLVSAINLSAGTTSNNLSAATFADANGVSFGLNGSVITASVAAAGGAQTGISALYDGANSISSGTVSLANANGVTFTINGNTLSGSVRSDWLSTQSNQALSGSNGSFTFQTATLGNLNGMSFYTSNGSIVGSYTVPTVTNSAWTVSDNATSGTVARLAFTNLNGVTLSLSTGAAGSHTIVGSHNALTSQSNQAASAANGSFAFQTISFSNLNGISFGTSAGSAITASHNALTSQSNQAFSASGGSSAFQTLNFVNGNGATFTNNAGSVGISYTVPTQTAQTVGGYAVGNTTGASSSSTIDARSFSIQGAGAASVGFSNGSWVVSAPNAAAGNVTFSAGTTSNGLADVVFSNSNGVSFGLNGSTITASVNAGGGGFTNSTFWYPQDRLITAVSAPVNGSMSVQLLLADANYSATRMGIMASMSPITSGDNRTFSFVYSHWCGIYTNNAGTLSSVSSTSMATTLGTWSSSGTSLANSKRMLTMPFNVNLTEGLYYIANILSFRAISTSTSSQTVAAMNITLDGGAFLTQNNYALLGVATNASLNEFFTGQGIYLTTQNAVPATINLTGMAATGTNAARANLALMFRA